MMNIRKTHPLVGVANSTFVDLATPSSISYMWNFGSLLGIYLILQIITGIFLAMHYCPEISKAYDSVVHIARDITLGDTIRCMHANGASYMFICLYLHVGRGMYYKSFKNHMAWYSGILMVFLTMGTAFLGYVLPWGQMSFWGATVITNLLSAVPYFGADLVKWLWGGFSVDNPTLSRFFALHYILPLILVGMAGVHLVFVHEEGASDPGLGGSMDKVFFSPYFVFKDVVGVILIIFTFFVLMLRNPYVLGDPDNFVAANPMVTPEHIQPEWYFLFAYAILRAVPNKLGGVIALVLSILVLAVLPLYNLCHGPMKFYALNSVMFWWFVMIFMLLTWAGAQPVEQPMIFSTQCLAVTYFMYFYLDGLVSNMWGEL